LALFDLGPNEWLLYLKTLDHASAHRRRRVEGIIQLPLFDLLPHEKVVGADEGSGTPRPRTYFHLVPQPSQDQDTEE
jgi:hypothetical protein